MKLVEILAKELGEWPDGATHAVQDGKRSFLRKVWVCNGDQANTEHDGCQWILGRGVFPCESIRATELATDHATAIVTREMWQAERDKQAAQISGISTAIAASDRACVRGLGDGSGLLTGYTSNPFAMRDRIHEIDATIEAMTAERAELVSKLASEGFALIERINDLLTDAAQKHEDMSDWRNWKVGDLVEVALENDCRLAVGRVVKLRSKESDEYGGPMQVSVFYDDDWNWPMAQDESGRCVFKWHSRPTA